MKQKCCICDASFVISSNKGKYRKTCSIECRKKMTLQNNTNENGHKCLKCGNFFNLDDFVQYKRNGTIRYIYCKKCWNTYTTHHKQKRKEKIVKLHGGKCSVCGYDKCINALEFHHIDPDKKTFGIANKYGANEMFEEAKKCILLCANCHRELHAIKI